MKYRILMVKYADEHEEFFVQRKGLFYWKYMLTLCYDSMVPVVYDTFDEAKDYITKQVKRNMACKVLAIEVVYEEEG